MEITPDKNLVISGEQTISISNTPISSGNNNSINRVYHATVPLTNFTGTLKFSYLEDELNGINQNNLILELQDEHGVWNAYEGSVNTTANWVSYVFDQEVSFKAVTASDKGATLSIEDMTTVKHNTVVYPNPTADRIFIKTQDAIEAELFDINGRKIQSTNQKQMDMSTLERGTYLLKVISANNQKKSFKIIKQ